MAGRRKQRPVPRWRERLASAQTPEQEMAAAYDWLRSSASRLARRGRRTGVHGEAHRLMREASRTLTALAEQADRLVGGDAS